MNIFFMRILIEMVNAVGIEKRTSSFNTVDDVAFTKQQLGKVSAILTGDAGDECDFGHIFLLFKLGKITYHIRLIKILFYSMLS